MSKFVPSPRRGAVRSLMQTQAEIDERRAAIATLQEIDTVLERLLLDIEKGLPVVIVTRDRRLH